jgi:hypothetical protein
MAISRIELVDFGFSTEEIYTPLTSGVKPGFSQVSLFVFQEI